MAKQKNNRCTISRCLCILCTLSLSLAILATLIWYFAFFTQDNPEAPASCGGCHCIVSGTDADTDATCPTQVPRTNYTADEMETWSSFTLLNPYRLSCNPYGNEDDCDTSPTQDGDLLSNGEESVCAVHFESTESDGDDNDIGSNSTIGTNGTTTTTSDTTTTTTTTCQEARYKLQTYPSFAAATAAGGFVTHTGHCGVCSSLQDFAVYVEHPDLTSQGKFCAEQGASLSFEVGRDCYRSLGLTDSCAAIWAHSSWNTAKECFLECLVGNEQQGGQDKPNNGPAPECKLNDCLQCDEEASAALFERIAGRTQLRSGLISSIARPCDRLVLGIEHEACPTTVPLERQ